MIQSYKLCKAMCAGLVVLALFSPLPVLAQQTIHVTNLDDSGAGSLRQAINFTALPGDTIVFDVTGTITLTSGELVSNSNLTISGPGAALLTISGNHLFRVFQNVGATVAISGLTFQNGRHLVGGGIYNGGTLTLTNSTLSGNSAQYFSGGIYNTGTLTLTNSTVSGNFGLWRGGGITNEGTLTVTNSTLSGNSTSGYGGGVDNYFGTLTVTNSTLSGNSAGSGGGIYHYFYPGFFGTGTATVTNSTLSGNSALWDGGGIYNDIGTLTVTNSTLSGNSAQNYGGGIYQYFSGTATVTNSTLSGNSAGSGGGIYNQWIGPVTLKNTIVANSLGGGNCGGYFAMWTSRGRNLSSDGTCASFFTQPGDMNSTDPLLDTGGLKDNGGPTQTIALLATSLAVDAIPVSPVNYCTETDGTTSIATDQRGVARPQGLACDIGAFERVLNEPPIANAGPDQTGVVNLSLTFNGSASSDPDGTIVSYQWDFGDYTTASGVTVSHTYSTAGSYTATLTVTDDGGATASDTAQVTIKTPAQATGTLMSEVLALELSRGIEQSLSAKLNAALASINQGDQLAKLAALNQLQAFIYQVSALQGVKLTPEEAASLIAAAQQIMQSLSS